MFVRLIFAVIYIFFGIITALLRSPIGRNNRNYYNNNYSYNDFSDWLQSKIKRHIAQRRAKEFLTKYKKTYTLKNKFVTVIYNTEEKEITCINRKDRTISASISWYKLKENSMYINDALLLSAFEETFNRLCVYFTHNITYENIITLLREDYEIKETRIKDKQPPKTQPVKKEPVMYVDEYFKGEYGLNKTTNVNSASEKELTILPGISIITAKKIIKYRELHNGFSSKEEFYKEMKIKPHFQKQLDNLISVNTVFEQEKQNENNERIIDL